MAREHSVRDLINDFIDELTSIDNNKIKKIIETESSRDQQSLLLGDILLMTSTITPEKLNEAIEVQKSQSKKEKLGEILLKKKYVTEDEIYNALSYQYNIPYQKKIDAADLDVELIKKIPINFAKKFKIIPIKHEEDFIIVAIENPNDLSPIDDIRILLETEIRLVLAKPTEIIEAINRIYDRAKDTKDEMKDFDENMDNLDFEEPQDLLESDEEAPIIRLVNSILFRAVKEGASDIHIEPFEKDLAVRYRIDGALYDVMKPPKKYQQSIATRIKIMAKLNIAEKRLPQDGRIRIKIAGKDIDVRLSTLPTSHGERIVMRLLDKSNVMLDLKTIGLSDKNYQKILEVIYKPHGIFLVTGPTGSGKTTTLYACLSKIYSVEKNIITVEDPVEYQLEGIGQIQINPKIDLTFANGLRSILRQDPDVIMIGEIRDSETAEIAVQASLTGHFVFSTLHTNDSFGAVTRLTDMEIEPFLVSSSLVAVLAQRLIRKVCLECRKPVTPTDDELKILNIKKEYIKGGVIYKAQGCDKCQGTGYKGRSGIYEFLPIDDEIRGLILKSVDSVTIKKAALARGMLTLRDDGALKVAEGVTTIEEVLKATQVDSVIEE